MDAIYDALTTCELFLSIGTSGNVYPAAGFVTLVVNESGTLQLFAREGRQGTHDGYQKHNAACACTQ